MPGSLRPRLAPENFDLGNVAAGTVNVDFRSSIYDAVIRLTLLGNVTLNLQNVPTLARVSIRVQQGSSAYTLTIQQDGSATTIDWDGGTAHAMSTAAGAVDRIAGEKAATTLELNTVGKGYA